MVKNNLVIDGELLKYFNGKQLKIVKNCLDKWECSIISKQHTFWCKRFKHNDINFCLSLLMNRCKENKKLLYDADL